VTDNTNSDVLWPEDLIARATCIIMNRFDLDAVQGLEALRRMSQNSRTQMCVVAEQIINHDVLVKAVRFVEDVLGSPETVAHPKGNPNSQARLIMTGNNAFAAPQRALSLPL